MSLQGLVVLVVLAPIAPVGSPEAIGWGKGSGHLVQGDGVSFELSGPQTVILQVRMSDDVRAKQVSVDLTRDGIRVSKNTVKLKPGGGGPKGYKLGGKVGFEVPAGKHTYKVTSAQPIAVQAAAAKKVPKPLMAAPEVVITSTGAVAAAPQPAAPPEAAPAPAAPPTPAAAPAEGMKELVAIAADARPGSEASQPAAGARRGQAIRVAVYDFQLQGIDQNVGAVVTASLLAEVRKLAGVAAIGMDEIRDMLSHEANMQLLGCESSESCLAEIGGALGVDEIVTGKLIKTGDEHSFSVTRLDQRRAQVAGAVNKRLKAESGQEFLAAIGPAVQELFPDRELKEGATRGVPKEMALRLDPPPLPAWSFWTTAGLASVTAAAGGVFGLLLLPSAQKDYDDYAHLGVPANMGGGGQVIDGATLRSKGDDLESRALMANTLLISAGVLAVATGVMYLFTDFAGYAEAGLHKEP